MERVDVAVVGAGQAGLATSHELLDRGIEHVVLERERIGQAWRGRWNSFCLVTPNWTVRLPGGGYAGDDPDGYLPRDAIVAHLERYAERMAAPVREGIAVESIASGGDGFTLRTSDGEIRGRAVVLACGRAPWGPRRLNGRDFVWWAVESGFLDQPLSSIPSPDERLFANVIATGHEGGHDLDLRILRTRGTTLTGHLVGAEDGRARFASDLAGSVAWGDERYRMTRNMLTTFAAERGIDPPDLPDPAPFDPSAPDSYELSRLGAVVFAAGFRPDYGALVPRPDALDPMGFPLHTDGASTVVPGLFFVGVHFLRKRKSSLLFGVGEDAAIIASSIAGRARVG